jgi:hypothetical protein
MANRRGTLLVITLLTEYRIFILLDSDCLFDSLSADCQESNLALSALVLTERANYLHPKELCIHHSVSIIEVFAYPALAVAVDGAIRLRDQSPGSD